jgi:hypothetical protein
LRRRSATPKLQDGIKRSCSRSRSILLVGAATEDDAIELGERLDSETPEGARIGVRGNPDDMPLPAFVNLSALKPGFLRDLSL